MTVGAISNTAILDPSQTVGASSWQTRMQQALGPVAQLFGESAQQLMSDLQSGKTSLSALAKEKGISQTDLLNAIKQGLQQSSANGGSQLSDTQLTNLANTIANRVHGGHHHHGAAMSGIGGASNANTTGTVGVGSDSDGDNDGSGGAGAGGVTSASGSASAVQTDVERLMFDLQSMLQSNASTASSSSQASANSTNTWSNSSSANLLNQLSQFDQTL